MRRFFLVFTAGLLACTGTVSLGMMPSDDTGGPPEAGGPLLEASADTSTNNNDGTLSGQCVSGLAFLDDFENGFPGLNTTGGANLGALNIDTSNPIDGAASLHVAPTSGGAPFAYLVYAQPKPTCRLTTSFRLRATASLIANDQDIVFMGAGDRAFELRVNAGGTLSAVQETISPNASTALATTVPVGQLVAGQVASVIFSVDLVAQTVSLRVDDQSTSAPIAQTADFTSPSLTGANIGVVPATPPKAAVDFWIDDLLIDTDPTLADGGGLPPYYDAAVLDATAPDAGFAPCGTVTTYNEAFENGLPTDIGLTNPTYISVDTTSPIDGLGSLELMSPPAANSYATFTQPMHPCTVSLSFKVRAGSDYAGNLAAINGVSRDLTLLVGPNGVLSLNEEEDGPIASGLDYGGVLYSLTPNQVSTVTLKLDVQAKTKSLTVDGQTTTQPLLRPDDVADPHLVNAIIGASPRFAPGNAGTVWVDDVTVQ